MIWPLAFMCPPLYAALYSAACARHAMVGMHPAQHRALMRVWYGV